MQLVDASPINTPVSPEASGPSPFLAALTSKLLLFWLTKLRKTWEAPVSPQSINNKYYG
jgi:hypothetical protein